MKHSLSHVGRLARRRSARAFAGVALLGLAIGCHDRISGVTTRSTEALHLVHSRVGGPALVRLSTSFYAKRGEAREVALFYHALPGAVDSTEFLHFYVPAGALATAPNGQPYAVGDSVLITVTVSDSTHLIVSFEPSGLRFDANVPAQLELSFAQADADLNGDGVVNATDTELTRQLGLWVQETPGGLWTRLSSAVSVDLKELTGEIPGFSGYACAY